MAWRVRRSIAGFLGRFPGGVTGFTLIALVPALLIVGYVALQEAIPGDFYLYVVNDALGAGSTVPSGATGINVKPLLEALIWALVTISYTLGFIRIGLEPESKNSTLK